MTGSDAARRILLVDDDPLLTDSLGFLLRQEGYETTMAASANEGLDLVRRLQPDLVLLDIGLPDLSGVETCRRMRASWAGPIIMLTARRQDTDKVVGLDAGADDYVTKPFVSSELLARVRAALRRAQAPAHGGLTGAIMTAGELRVDRNTREVTVNHEPVHLSAREFDLLLLLIERPGHVVTRRFLIDTIWGPDFYGDERALDVYIRALRKKIEPDPDHPTYIQTLRGVGYRIDVQGDET